MVKSKSMSSSSPNQYFRAGAGSILYTSDNSIICFSRSDNSSIWQFPQGGIDNGESPIDTLWRELYEETAITRDMIGDVTLYPKWTLYEYPPALQMQTSVIGQVHRWFFLRLNNDTLPNLAHATDKEFLNWKVMTFDDFLKIPSHDFKLPVYTELANFFATTISHQ
jgi:putative (di)nucleoside polyphosphate hydrolase